MQRKVHRGEKLGEEIRRIVSELLARELKDPVFDGLISISYVKSTDDGSFATVYFTSLGADDAAVAAGFEKAKGFIRNEIGRRLGIRRAPELRFRPDDAERYGAHIDQLIDSLELQKDVRSFGKTLPLEELAEVLDAYERYLVFTHIHMDGDTLGAAVAFADAMREIGREAWVVVGEEPPESLRFICTNAVVLPEEAEQLLLSGANPPASESALPYLSVAVDFTDKERLEGREQLFDGAAETLAIDHHITSEPLCDYNHIAPDSASTAELVYRLLKLGGLPVTERIATALYAGIVTDTGRFQYSSTTPETHRAAAELIEAGADFETAFRDIYQSVKAEKLFVQRAMLNTLDIFADGKAALAFVSAETLSALGAGDDETGGMSELLRSIIGIEVSAFLREQADGKIKVSMRSKDFFDVAALSAVFGGGGHIRAAGFSTTLSMAEAVATLKEKLTAALR